MENHNTLSEVDLLEYHIDMADHLLYSAKKRELEIRSILSDIALDVIRNQIGIDVPNLDERIEEFKQLDNELKSLSV